MNNIIYIGNYSVKKGQQSAGAKRVLNQIVYLEKYYDILLITFSPQKSDYPFNKNFYTKHQKTLTDVLRYPIYWIFVAFIFWKRKKQNNYLLLESIVELHSMIPLILGRLLGYKIIHDVVEDFSYQSSLDMSKNQKFTAKLSGFFEKNISKYCSGIIVISENLFQKFIQRGLPIIKLYNSVPYQAKPVINENPQKYKLFYSGRYGPKDGVLDLIDGFEKAFSRNENIELHLVGGGSGNYFMQCLKRIERNPNINYHGFVSENLMFTLLSKSNICCVTRPNSTFANNGFPFKLAEYMSFGIPVLTTKVSDIPLLLKDNVNAFFALPENSDSIAKTICFIIDNYSQSMKVGEAGQIYCQKEFSTVKIGQILKEFINSL